MEKINFQNATLKTQAHVIISGQTYNVVDSEYTGGTNLDANTLNQFAETERTGRLVSLIIDVKNEKQLEEVLSVVRFKKQLK